MATWIGGRNHLNDQPKVWQSPVAIIIQISLNAIDVEFKPPVQRFSKLAGGRPADKSVLRFLAFDLQQGPPTIPENGFDRIVEMFGGGPKISPRKAVSGKAPVAQLDRAPDF